MSFSDNCGSDARVHCWYITQVIIPHIVLCIFIAFSYSNYLFGSFTSLIHVRKGYTLVFEEKWQTPLFIIISRYLCSHLNLYFSWQKNPTEIVL